MSNPAISLNVQTRMTIPVIGHTTLLIGNLGGGIRYAGERILAATIAATRPDSRRVFLIDLKNGELSRWNKVVDTLAIGLEEANHTLSQIRDELARRAAAGDGYVDETPLIVYLNDIDGLAFERSSEWEEAHRTHAIQVLEELTDDRLARFGLTLIAECYSQPRLANLPFVLERADNVIAGHSADLPDHWLLARLADQPDELTAFRVVGEPHDADLKRVATDPNLFVDRS